MDNAINAAIKRLDFVTRDKEFLRYYYMRQMALSDYNSSVNYAHEEGRAEGIVEGRAEGMVEGRAEEKLEIARKMKAAGRPLSEIEEFTGLPLESIERM